MAINVDFVHTLCYNVAAKQQRAFPSPDEWNSYANTAQTDLYNYYQDEKAKMLLKIKSGENLFFPQSLTNFVVNNQLLAMSPSTGSASLPVNYAYNIALKTPVLGVNKTIKEVELDKVENYLNSTIDKPTVTSPIFVELDTAMQIYPPNVNVAYMTYYKYPAAVKWAYTLVNKRPVYDAKNSVDFDWPESELIRLTMRILNYMGTSLRDTELMQYAQQQTKEAS